MIEYPVIPRSITVHLGAPKQNAENVTLPFADYIKNVASSEVYPTWPVEAIKANVYAEVSVALNRVYTEYYRSSGFAFDITSLPAYDQAFVYQRTIYDNISAIVDSVFTSYIKRRGFVEPLFAAFCDGIRVSCSGLSQWGSVDLAKQGLNAEQIIKRYYGTDVLIVENVPIEDVMSSVPAGLLREGDTGRDVEILQRRLNRISVNFPGIPKITPADGYFGPSTTAAVRAFQFVFGLVEDGIVGRATWYKVQGIYLAVKRVFEVTSEGIRYADLSTQYESELKQGVSSLGVFVLQYYLRYISLYVPSVPSVTADGVFGPMTEAAVISFQRSYGLPETGIVDRTVWNKMQNVYLGLVRDLPASFSEGDILPFPGRILRVGLYGDDVRVLQSYLAFLSRYYREIPNVEIDGDFGVGTEAAVAAFQKLFTLPTTPGRVNALTWNAIASIYEDKYRGGLVNRGQNPGYTLS